MENKLKLFNEKQIRTEWNAEEEEWYFSVVDVVAVLTDSVDPKQYIKKMRSRDPELDFSWGTICTLTKMQAADGKYYKTTVANTKGILRLIQSIPSPKAEPFKLWLAQVGSERLDEIADPEKAVLRAQAYYRRKGYSEEWIKERMGAIAARKALTDEWKAHGVKDDIEFAILTNDMTKAWSGKTVREYKEYKGLHKENLRDNMTDIELALNSLAEVTTRALTAQRNPRGLEENRQVAKRGGHIAKNARENIEEELGHSVISPLNAGNKGRLTTRNMDEVLPLDTDK
jgi:hypothetical protein